MVYRDNGGESEREEGVFVETLRDLMRSWRWPEWQVERELPVVLKVCEGVGIIRATGEGYEVTELVTSRSAWGLVARRLKEAGLIEGGRLRGIARGPLESLP